MAPFRNRVNRRTLIKLQFLIFSLIVINGGGVFAQSSDAAVELLAVQQERFDAAIAKDILTLEQMVADEVRYCHTTGAVDCGYCDRRFVWTGFKGATADKSSTA